MAVQLAVTFPQKTLVRLTASFTDVDGAPVDPDYVSAKLKDPDDVVTLHGYLDSPADIVRDAAGEYHLDVTPDVAGKWFYRFEATGVGQAANEAHFFVAESAFP